MTAGAQCDNCRTFAPMPMTGWIHLVVQQADPSGLAAIFGASQAGLVGSFCSMRCVAEYAMANALIEGPAAGEEPPVAPEPNP